MFFNITAFHVQIHLQLSILPKSNGFLNLCLGQKSGQDLAKCSDEFLHNFIFVTLNLYPKISNKHDNYWRVVDYSLPLNTNIFIFKWLHD